ncbi:MAG: 6-bladed beta-propeller [Tannerella sp.]|jgi:hypothetical protein|nr:6-bladed beta-propeller [Tannerella sp.]
MKKLIYIFLFPLAILSCHTKGDETNTIETIRVDLENSDYIRLSSFFDRISYTLLEDSESSLIGEIDKMEIKDGYLFIVSYKKVLVFDAKTGAFTSGLDNHGEGPGKYISLTDMYPETSGKKTEILDMGGRKIIQYDYDGNMIKEIPLPFSSLSFHKKDNDYYLFFNGNITSDDSDARLIHYNAKDQKIEHEYFPVDKHMAQYFHVFGGRNFNRFSRLSFVSSPEHIIYEITDDWETIPLYKIDFGKNQTPESFYEKDYSDIADFATKAISNGYIYMLMNLVEDDKYIFFSNRYNDKTYWSVYDKKTHKINTGHTLIDDINFDNISLIPDYDNYYDIDNNSFYYLIYPEQFIELVENYKVQNGDEKFNTLLETHPDISQIYNSPGFNDQSNPILVTCKF